MTNIPIPAELIFMFGTSAIELALSGGEDYELVFTAPKTIVQALQEENGSNITVIGQITDDEVVGGKVRVVDATGDDYEPIRKGWDHLNG